MLPAMNLTPGQVALILLVLSVPGLVYVMKHARADHLEEEKDEPGSSSLAGSYALWIAHVLWGPTLLLAMFGPLAATVAMIVTVNVGSFLRYTGSRDSYLLLLLANAIMVGLVPALGPFIWRAAFPIPGLPS